MKTDWYFSPRLENQRLLHTAHNISNGFYKANHFLIVPDTGIQSDNSVVFPDLEYLSIPRFWARAIHIKVQTDPVIKISSPKDFSSDTASLLGHPASPEIRDISSRWQKISDVFFKEIGYILPYSRNFISSITIWPTHIGTTCSFNVLTRPGPLQIWLREDQDIGTIAEAVLSALTRSKICNQLEGSWSESEIIVDWLLSCTRLSDLFPRTPKTVKATRSLQTATAVSRSNEYLRRLGSPTISLDQIKNVDTADFSFREKELLRLLIDRSPQIVTIDEITDLIFSGDPDRFSLYAISKSIQRLRDRLESSGISGSFIQTKRGEGYLLAS